VTATMAPEENLAARLRAGEPRAFHAVYDLFGDRLYSFALRLSGRRDVADELFQHAWLRLAEHAPRMSPRTNLLAWLLTVARNHFRSQHRRASTELRHEQAIAATQSAPSRPDVSAERRILVERLEAALASLPADHREVLIVMIEADAVPQHELARVLDVTPEVFRKRLSRARRALAELLEDQEER
jgi:RNA polymerase sigma-70 factor, ECF subfamily